MPAVRMPDGTVVDLPDNPSPELKAAVQAKVELGMLQQQRSDELERANAARDAAQPGKRWLFDATSPRLDALDEEIGKRKTALERATAMQGGMLDKAGYYAKQGGSAILRGLLSLPAMAASAGIALDPMRYRQSPAAPLQSVAALGAQPQTQGERYLAAGLEGAAGAVASPGGLVSPIQSAIVGAGSALGSEGAAQAFGDKPYTRILGGLAGGGLMSLATAPKRTRESLVREATRDAREQDMRQAQQLMREAQQQGVPLNVSQAMPEASNLDEMAAALARSRNGPEVVRGLRTQPRAVYGLVASRVGELPGTATQPQVAANRVQEAADSAIDEQIRRAGAAWQAANPQGSTIPASAVAALDAKLADLAAKHPNTSGAAMIEEARQALSVPGPSGSPQYLTDALKLKGALQDTLSTFGSRRLNTSSLDAANMRLAQEVRNAFRDVVAEHAPKLAQADAAYSKVMSESVAPMKQSVVGRIAGRAGYDETREAVQSRVFDVLDRGTATQSGTSEILALEKAMRGQPGGPEAFQDAVKTWMSQKVATAAKQTGGRQSAATAGTLEKAFVGDAAKTQGFKDMLVGLARSQGLPDDSLLKGMQNAMKITSAAARRPGSVAGTTQAGLQEASRSKVASAVGKWSMVQPIRQPFRALDDWLNADAYGFLDQLLTTPEGVDTLIKLSKKPPLSKASVDALATFAATAPAAVQEPAKP
ncbi:MAG: hypothetical protein AzoDbin1_05115 [Azoarcus sp.]|nr:hypothetical protein [Azoarcus sp.]